MSASIFSTDIFFQAHPCPLALLACTAVAGLAAGLAINILVRLIPARMEYPPVRSGLSGAFTGWKAALLAVGCAAGSAALLFFPLPEWRFAALLPLGWGLLALSLIDARHKLLPDVLTLPLLGLGLAFNCLGFFVPLGEAALGAAGGYLFFFGFNRIFFACTGRHGMGGGDFKLLALLGAWGGWRFLPVLILLASAAALLIHLSLRFIARRLRSRPVEKDFPFGPYLAAAGWFLLLQG